MKNKELLLVFKKKRLNKRSVILVDIPKEKLYAQTETHCTQSGWTLKSINFTHNPPPHLRGGKKATPKVAFWTLPIYAIICIIC